MPKLPLPTDISWKLIDASHGMMDTVFCDSSHPPHWRPSIAIFAYEPDQDTIPGRCGQRYTYLKVSVSATGIQPPLAEDEEFEAYSDVDFFNLAFAGQYLACYGVLLNVAVFPERDDEQLDDYPRIVDFEPKNRELIQTASVEGEVLTASSSRIGTDKSFSKTSGNELGTSHGLKYTSPESKYGKVEVSHNISGKWTNTQEESSSVNTDASIERRERYANQTTLSQLYNLLSGYHIGTNRATFLMLPRPHAVQPTQFRTFVHGIRQIEGVQDFFMILSQPEQSAGMRIEVTLDTGHHPEDVPIPFPTTRWETDTIDIPVVVLVQGSGATEGRLQQETLPRTVPVPPTWEVDPSSGDPGRGGVELVSTNFSEGMHSSDLKMLEYSMTEGQLIVTYRIERGLWADDDTMTLLFRVHIRREVETTRRETPLGSGFFVGTRTQLCTGIAIDDGCVVRNRPSNAGEGSIQITGEQLVRLPPHLAQASDEEFSRSAPHNALATMRSFLAIQSRRSVNARPTGYSFTRAFSSHLSGALPETLLKTKVGDVPNLSDRYASLSRLTVSQFMSEDAVKLARKLNLSAADIVRARLELARFHT